MAVFGWILVVHELFYFGVVFEDGVVVEVYTWVEVGGCGEAGGWC